MAGASRIRPRTGEPTIRRWVNEDFGPYTVRGVPTTQQLKDSRTFAAKVSAFAEQAVDELLRGDLGSWGKAGAYNAGGARLIAFLDLLTRGHSTAVTHAGNIIEERVYQLLVEAKMTQRWNSQHTIGTSRPDVTVELGPSTLAAIDITSEIAHIVKKVGLWSTSDIVYVGEAVFDSVTAAHLQKAKAAIQSGKALSRADRAMIEAEIEAERKRKRDAAEALKTQRNKEFLAYGTMKKFADAKFGGSLAKASAYLREAGITKKGMSRRPGGKKQSGLDVLDRIKKDRAARQAQAALRAKAKRAAAQAKNRPGLATAAVPEDDEDMTAGSEDEQAEAEQADADIDVDIDVDHDDEPGLGDAEGADMDDVGG